MTYSLSPHDRLVKLISGISATQFRDRTEAISAFIEDLPSEEFQVLLLESGVIPEHFAHDSSDEKAYAKAMDILVASALSKLGYLTSVNTERSNAADVTASWSQVGLEYSGVLDAKAFRLSRSALNPKDYKIAALSSWRYAHDFACLVGPAVGFPVGDSRLYQEALSHDVTLLTFSHLGFLLDLPSRHPQKLSAIWHLQLPSDSQATYLVNAQSYWKLVDNAVSRVSDESPMNLGEYQHSYLEGLLVSASKQLSHFEAERSRISSLSRESLEALAASALKLDNKEAQVHKKVRATAALIAELNGPPEPQ